MSCFHNSKFSRFHVLKTPKFLISQIPNIHNYNFSKCQNLTILEFQNHNFSKCQIYKMSNFQRFRFYKALIIYQSGSRLVSDWMDFLFKSFLFQHTFIQNANLWPHLRAPHCCEVSSVSI